MKKIAKDIYIVDYSNDTLEDIRKAERGRLKLLIEQLNDTDRLCSNIGTSIVSEFQFRGSLDDVKKQLADLLKYYEENELTENDRKQLIMNSDRLANHQFDKRSDYYTQESRKYLISDLDKAGTFLEAILKRRNMLHDKKECLCYSNLIVTKE